MKYDTALKNQWSNICDEIEKGSLNPTNEDELVKMVVKKLNDDKLIYNPVESKVRCHGDMKYYKIKQSCKFNGETECIFTGVKILSDSKNKQRLLNESKETVSYLYNKYTEGAKVRDKLIIYDKTNTLTDNDIKYLKKDCQKTYRVKIHLC